MKHAAASGQVAVVEGEQTELRRQRFVSPLESLFRASEITGAQFAAARRYAKDHDLAQVVGPAQAMRYAPRWVDDAGAAFLLPIEKMADFLMRLARAQDAIGTRDRRVLDWIATEGLGWRQTAALWYRGFSEPMRAQLFKTALRRVCNGLEEHYEWVRRR